MAGQSEAEDAEQTLHPPPSAARGCRPGGCNVYSASSASLWPAKEYNFACSTEFTHSTESTHCTEFAHSTEISPFQLLPFLLPGPMILGLIWVRLEVDSGSMRGHKIHSGFFRASCAARASVELFSALFARVVAENCGDLRRSGPMLEIDTLVLRRFTGSA